MARSLFDELDVEWQQLSVATAAKRALRIWDIAAFSGFRDLDALVVAINQRDDVVRSDDLLREVVKRAANDDLACRTALQSLTPAMRSLTWRYRLTQQRSDLESSVIVETLDMIRNYPIERRPDRIAANISRDVQNVFWRARQRSIDVDVVDPALLGRHQPSIRSGSHEVVDLLRDGLRTGSVSEDEAALIFATRVLDEPIGDLARRAGVLPQSIRKRRGRAEARLEAVGVEL